MIKITKDTSGLFAIPESCGSLSQYTHLLHGDINADDSIVIEGIKLIVHGSVRTRQSIDCDGSLHASSIEAGGMISVRNDLSSDDTIRAGGSIWAESITAKGDIRSTDGSIYVKEDLSSGGSISAAEHINAENITAEKGVTTGLHIIAKERITAGAGYGISAGVSPELEDWQGSRKGIFCKELKGHVRFGKVVLMKGSEV